MGVQFRKFAESTTSTLDNTVRTEVKFKLPRRAIVFFAGGAGDKESFYGNGPFGNISDVMDVFSLQVRDLEKYELYDARYLGYNGVKGDADIRKNVLSRISTPDDYVYIVGHSLGGWNGAHLSSILTQRGYTVDLLITLDPVGEGAMVAIASDIHMNVPRPTAKFWINITAKPESFDETDWVAWMGHRWTMDSGPDINYIANINHWNAKRMFLIPIKNQMSAADFLNSRIRHNLIP